MSENLNLHNPRFYFIIGVIFLILIIISWLIISAVTGKKGYDLEVNILNDDFYLEHGEQLEYEMIIEPYKNYRAEITMEVSRLGTLVEKVEDNSRVIGVEKEVLEKNLNENLRKNKIKIIREMFDLSGLEPGTYRLKVNINSKEFEKFDYKTFIIKKSETQDPEEEVEVIDTSKPEPKENQDSEVDLILTDKLTLKEIIEKARINPEEAKAECMSSSNKDSCLSLLARNLNKDGFCADIENQENRDGCYLNIALQGNFRSCNNIIDETQKQACKSIFE